jgi:hypothetical protein
MKKVMLSSVIIASLFASNTDLEAKIKSLENQLKELKSQVQSQDERYYSKVAPVVSNTKIFWHYDLRSSVDYLYYETKNDKLNNVVFSNRVILTGLYKASDELKATLKISANSLYGMNGAIANSPNNNISWVANETADDTNIRIKEAFFNYFFGDGYMISAGRRPSTNGYPANLREGDTPESPVAHLVNMEFDGISFWIQNAKFADLSESFEDWGTNLKFCFGRGYSSSVGKWNKNPAYSKDTLNNTDFGGFLLVPYNNGQYSVWSETIFAWNMKGYASLNDYKNNIMSDLGSYFGENLIFKADGVGDGISDFLDDTKAFISFAFSRTSPGKTKQMLGSNSSKNGYSLWIGADMPANEDGDRFGVNLVLGSKYWKSMTYGEDTLAGSIAAVRGQAIDAYYIHEIIPHLTTNFRFTYLNYNNAGSEGFFGITGDPNQNDYVKKAMDIRAYIRYNF